MKPLHYTRLATAATRGTRLLSGRLQHFATCHSQEWRVHFTDKSFRGENIRLRMIGGGDVFVLGKSKCIKHPCGEQKGRIKSKRERLRRHAIIWSPIMWIHLEIKLKGIKNDEMNWWGPQSGVRWWRSRGSKVRSGSQYNHTVFRPLIDQKIRSWAEFLSNLFLCWVLPPSLSLFHWQGIRWFFYSIGLLLWPKKRDSPCFLSMKLGLLFAAKIWL